ncbi:hypothetical protein LZ31DRAFT_139780 [Colletotrichum somersetense]|nr:hypothetical protein LZ31DRAFT_139780 [Colletotrichum somersetense]
MTRAGDGLARFPAFLLFSSAHAPFATFCGSLCCPSTIPCPALPCLPQKIERGADGGTAEGRRGEEGKECRESVSIGEQPVS